MSYFDIKMEKKSLKVPKFNTREDNVLIQVIETETKWQWVLKLISKVVYYKETPNQKGTTFFSYDS